MKTHLTLLAGCMLWIAPAMAADTASFITFGDWGYETAGQKSVAKAATQYCKRNSCELVLALGDNFYEFGVSSTNDPKWKHYYKDIYADLHLPFYALIGNHDELGSVQAQIDYSKIDSSWHMPAEDYSFTLPLNSETPIVEIFVINNGDKKLQPEEKTWLTRSLLKSRAPWKILAMHEPIISNGKHGDNPATINDALVPIICGKIDFVLSGHDHSFSHLKGPWAGCTIDQMIVGTGGRNIRSVNTKDPRVLSTGSFYGFGWYSGTAEKLTFRMIKDDGSVSYETSWKKSAAKH